MKRNVKSSAEKNRGGRPAKFAEPRRPVTMTLPERVLRLLAAVDADRAKAVVKLAETLLGAAGRPPLPVAKVAIGEGRAILLVNHCAGLARLPWLRQVEVAPGRHLLSIRSGTTIESVELGLRDVLDELPAASATDREIIEQLLGIVRSSRRANGALKEEILFVAAEVEPAT